MEMFRVAKDLGRDTIIKGVVTTDLVMEKDGRALVVPQIDPSEIMNASPYTPLNSFFKGKERYVKISCSSTPISEVEACSILINSEDEVSNLQETLSTVFDHCPQFYYTAGVIVDVELKKVVYSISTGGRPFSDLPDVLNYLKDAGAEIYVASGDSKRSLSVISSYMGINQDHIYPVSTPRRKEEIVLKLKKRCNQVVMVGDGLNDIYALRAADLGVLTIQQDSRPSNDLIKAADVVINNIVELPNLLNGI